jgi:prephenate dehydrogenase
VWSSSITAFTKGTVYEKFGDMKGELKRVSKNAIDVVTDADIILITSPAHTKNQILKEIKPHLKTGALVGTVFG